MPTVTQEELTDLTRKLLVTVTPEDYEAEVDQQVKDYSKRANLDGFRKGKVPAGVIKRMFGDQIIAEALSKAVNSGLNNYLKESGLQILGDPVPDDSVRPEIDINVTKDYEFAYEVGLQPEFDVRPVMQTASLSRYIVKVSEEMIDEEVDRLASRHGKTEGEGEQAVVTKAAVDQELFDKTFGPSVVQTELDFRERIGQELRSYLERGTGVRLESDIFEHLVNHTPMTLPEEFLKRWLLRDAKNLDEEQLEKEFSPFVRNLKWNLIVNRLQTSEGIQVSKEEIQARFRELVMRQYGLNDTSEESKRELDHIVGHLMEEEEQVKRTYESIRDNKIFAYLRQNMKVEEKVVSYEEFKSLTEKHDHDHEH